LSVKGGGPVEDAFIGVGSFDVFNEDDPFTMADLYGVLGSVTSITRISFDRYQYLGSVKVISSDAPLIPSDSYSPFDLLLYDLDAAEYYFDGNDVFIANLDGDHIHGFAGDDVFYGSFDRLASRPDEDDIFIGGEGVDRIIFDGNSGDYLINSTTLNLGLYSEDWPISDAFSISLKSNPSETSTIQSVELLQFNDVVYELNYEEGLFEAYQQPEIQTEEVHAVNLIANVFGSIIYLKGLTETITDTSHIIDYKGEAFNYEEVDSFVMTVVRDGDFTDEFAQEISESFPLYSSLSYGTAVSLIGVSAIDDILISVAGADGNYVG